MSVEERLQRLVQPLPPCPPPPIQEQPAIQYSAPSKLALITASKPVLSPSPSPAASAPSASHIPRLATDEDNRPSHRAHDERSSVQLPWPQCQGNCPRSPSGQACRDLNCALKSPHTPRINYPASPCPSPALPQKVTLSPPSNSDHSTSLFSTSPSPSSPPNTLLQPPSVNITPFAALEHAAVASPEASFSTTIPASGESTRERIDFRVHQSPSQHLTPCSTPEVRSQEADCGYADVEAELDAIIHRASPPRSSSNPMARGRPDTPTPISNMAYHTLPRAKTQFREDPDIFAPLQYDTTYSSRPEPSVDSELLSELVTDTTGFTQERAARREKRRMEKQEKQREQESEKMEKMEKARASRGPPTHAILYDEEERNCGRVPLVFSLVGGVSLPDGSVGPALVAQPQIQAKPKPAVVHSTPKDRQSDTRAQSLRTHHMKAKMPPSYTGQNSRPSSRESGPTSETHGTYVTARGISPAERAQTSQRPLPRLPGAPPPATATGYDGRYPPLPAQPTQTARQTSVTFAPPPQPSVQNTYTVPATPITNNKPTLDALIAAQIATPHPIPGIHHSVPQRDNVWDDLFATALYGLAYSSLSRNEKKEVQRTKIVRGAQISASGSKGLAKIKAGEVKIGAKVVGRSVAQKMGRMKPDRAYTQQDYEFDAVGNMYARYADEPDESWRGQAEVRPAVPPKTERVERERPVSRPASRASTSGRSEHSARTVAPNPNGTNGRRYLEGEV